MKAEFYFTLLDGLLATAVYHPHNSKPRAFLRALNYWFIPLSCATGAPADSLSTTVTSIPAAVNRACGSGEHLGMGTSATPVCAYCLPVRG